jgi:DNA-binding NarL/FixJ family response regulator
MSGRSTRVAICSTQEVVAKGLTAMLGEHPDRFVVVDPSEADVVLYDSLAVHVDGGAELRHLVSGDRPVGGDRPVVLAISRDLRPDLRARALAQGAHAWVSMSASTSQLVEAVEAAADGRELPAHVDRLGASVGLTPREVEVLALIAQGMSNLEIAERLFLSINSVKTYIRSAYAKIGATSRSRAVAWCLQHGFAPPDD